MKQEIQVHERHHADNNKTAERVRNSIVDSNKLQAELESNSPVSQIVSQTIPSNNTTTSPMKRRLYNAFVKACFPFCTKTITEIDESYNQSCTRQKVKNFTWLRRRKF